MEQLKRVVITGSGAVSSIGTKRSEIEDSLRNSKSGITFQEEYQKRGFRSCVAGNIDLDKIKDREALIDRRHKRFMSKAAAQTWLATQEALEEADLSVEQHIKGNRRAGAIIGSGGPSTDAMHLAWRQMEAKNRTKAMGPYVVPKAMSSSLSAMVATVSGLQGISYTITSACTTSLHCAGNAYDLIAMGKQDIMIAGGGEEIDWSLSCFFDAMGALSSSFNDTPDKASRAYDKDRDGFVIAGGSGILVLEELEHALKRKANILAEVVGFAANSDGYDMVVPSGEGAERCMKMLMEGNTMPVDYINTHGTSTPVGDIQELDAIKKVFGDNIPKISSTKSLSGHSLGATGAQELVFTLLMMNNDFIAGSANIENLDEGAKGYPIVTKSIDAKINQAISNSFGFGGTNGAMILRHRNAML